MPSSCVFRSCTFLEEFATWKWELPIRISAACGWGLPDSNDLDSDAFKVTLGVGYHVESIQISNQGALYWNARG